MGYQNNKKGEVLKEPMKTVKRIKRSALERRARRWLWTGRTLGCTSRPGLPKLPQGLTMAHRSHWSQWIHWHHWTQQVPHPHVPQVPRLLFVSALLLCLFCLFCGVGCSLVSSTTPSANPGAAQIESSVTQNPHRGLVLVDGCVENDKPYPRSLFHQAMDVLARSVESLVQPNAEGAVAYVTLVDAAPLRPENTVSVLTIAPTPPLPTPPALTPTPTTDPSNPYASAQAQATVAAHNQSATDDFLNRFATARAGGTPRGTDTGLGDPSSRADTDSGPKPAADQRLHRPRQPASERLAWGGEVSRQRGDAPAANRASGMV